ncbi:hypothetical protein P3T23_006492 [Paraburkholderia sp. GAS448]
MCGVYSLGNHFRKTLQRGPGTPWITGAQMLPEAVINVGKFGFGKVARFFVLLMKMIVRRTLGSNILPGQNR